MKPYISDGNAKTGSIPTFSLPARKTCPGCTVLCASLCYARKAEIQYKETLPSRKRNLQASALPTFVFDVIDWIEKRDPKFFRVHESGDFYNQMYLDKWFAICRACPSTRFLAFTKSFKLDYSWAPSNLTIIWSIWPDTDTSSVPNGPRAYAGDCVQTPVIDCPGFCDGCGLCWNIAQVGRDVHFDIH